MKILMILHESPFEPRGGLGMHVAGVAREIAAAGHDLVVLGVTYGYEGGLWRVDQEGTRRQCPTRPSWGFRLGDYRVVHTWGRNHHLCDSTSQQDRETCEAMLESFMLALPDERFDVVHLHDTILAPVARVIAARDRAAFVVTSHLSHTVSRDVAGLGWDDQCAVWLAEQEAAAYHRADRVIAVSEAYAVMLRDRFMVDNIDTIPNGVDAEDLEAIGALFRPTPKHAVYIGRPAHAKGVLEIIEAARLLPEWRFTLISSVARELYDHLPIIQRMGEAPRNVRWIPMAGFGRERWAWAASACVALMPSHHEPFGIAALEWMALGVPLISSRVDGLGEFCTDENSWHCAISAGGIAEALRTWRPDPARTLAARQTARDHSWSRTADATLGAYGKAIHANTVAT